MLAMTKQCNKTIGHSPGPVICQPHTWMTVRGSLPGYTPNRAWRYVWPKDLHASMGTVWAENRETSIFYITPPCSCSQAEHCIRTYIKIHVCFQAPFTQALEWDSTCMARADCLTACTLTCAQSQCARRRFPGRSHPEALLLAALRAMEC
jgi:hypothetical protein